MATYNADAKNFSYSNDGDVGPSFNIISSSTAGSVGWIYSCIQDQQCNDVIIVSYEISDAKMASTPPQRPKRRPKKPQNMSFRSLPPLPPPPLPPEPPPGRKKEEVFVSNQSHLLVGVQSVNPLLENCRAPPNQFTHRKWVKLRTHYDLTASHCGVKNEVNDDSDDVVPGPFISASTVYFRFHSDPSSSVMLKKYNGCEMQEVSVWLDDHEFCEGEGSKS